MRVIIDFEERDRATFLNMLMSIIEDYNDYKELKGWTDEQFRSQYLEQRFAESFVFSTPDHEPAKRPRRTARRKGKN